MDNGAGEKPTSVRGPEKGPEVADSMARKGPVQVGIPKIPDPVQFPK